MRILILDDDEKSNDQLKNKLKEHKFQCDVVNNSIGKLKINFLNKEIIYNDKQIILKGKPLEVFLHLARCHNQIVSKDKLHDSIWEEPERSTLNTIDRNIYTIKQKIDKPLGIKTIENVRRRGYRFCFKEN